MADHQSFMHGSRQECTYHMLLPCAPETAFKVFEREIDRWWPMEYRFSEMGQGVVGMEAREGGLCFEDLPDGRRLIWGTVLKRLPGDSLRIAWQISPNSLLIPLPEEAGEVIFRFAPVGNNTRFEVKHVHFERYGEGWPGYLEAMSSGAGWAFILRGFKKRIQNDR
ncbi:SRPBCC family protein [Pseudovibrio sp. SPO723]|uniref:SRPBCC family protein n=1 Tax=Nesiotobacter zosterae TaxID=392721 RepID=UPI0029C2B9A8|nr:SRPBCC family protein [Pseudovibrio sp. SPO723]MDX5593138.1 SRPBCC family protein [Pseudovibrio sp. SPO723]